MTKKSVSAISPRDLALLRQVALFRYELRLFLRFSERAARECGVTPQQHQLLLGLAGFTKSGFATITELAEFLQERHNAVVGLVERAVERGLVRKDRSSDDHRMVRVRITRAGAAVLKKLTRLHLDDLRRVRAQIYRRIKLRPRPVKRGNQG
jgi:DNA-binding MarR family transcriptional regulator